MRKTLIAVLLSLPLGGIAGFAFGYAVRGHASLFGLFGYLSSENSDDILFWVLAGMAANALLRSSLCCEGTAPVTRGTDAASQASPQGQRPATRQTAEDALDATAVAMAARNVVTQPRRSWC
jgi:hypothetical protein